MDHGRRRKLLVLQTHPIQYYAPIYRALAQRDRIEVKVIYLTDAGAKAHHDPGFGQQISWDIPLLEGYEYHILQPDTEITHRNFWQRHDSNLVRVLAEERPDWILLYGYASRMNWSALTWARRYKICVAYTSDTNIRLMRRGWRGLAKQFFIRWYFKQIDTFLSPSEANRDYLLALGAQTSKIRWCPFAIEFKRFKADSPLNTINHIDFIWVGKMIAVKRPMDFVNAIAELLHRGHQQVSARMIGSGPMFNHVLNGAETISTKKTISFSGFVNQLALPAELHRGRIFVFTSEGDQYGLATTEASACSLALIVADINGCVGTTASAQPNVNTLIYPAGDIQALADCMETLLTNPERLKSMQEASIAIAAEHDVSRAAAIIESVILEENADHA